MEKKLFIGNLSFSTSDADLKELFSTVGTCERATVLMDRMSGRSRGFGFVEMGSAEEAQRAISQLNGRELQGRSISVSEARERSQGGPPPRKPAFSRPSQDDAPSSRPRFRREGGSRRGLRARKRSL
jgi:RNA recognition motif-containing protein